MAQEAAEQTQLIDPSLIQAKVVAPSEVAPTPRRKEKAKPTADQLAPGQYCWGTGRRKSAVARVRIRPGEGNILVNGRAVADYFVKQQDRNTVKAPLEATETLSRFDVFVNVSGGGHAGQAGAVRLGIARALVKANAGYEPPLREKNYLTRDARVVERKKYGQRKARRRFQFSKR